MLNDPTSQQWRDPGEEKPEQAWWLDVASPPWEGMRTLGKASISLFILLTAKLTQVVFKHDIPVSRCILCPLP
jgi:hypothetical protein